MMSAHLGMSRVNLYKRMLSVTGKTPSEFIRAIRLMHAEPLLRECKYNVREVAYRIRWASTTRGISPNTSSRLTEYILRNTRIRLVINR